MKYVFSLSNYEEEFLLPRLIKYSKIRLLSASIYNEDLTTSNEPIFINIENHDQNYEFIHKTYYTTVLFPHARNSWYVFSRDLINTFDYQSDFESLINKVNISIYGKSGSLGSYNKINLEFEFI